MPPIPEDQRSPYDRIRISIRGGCVRWDVSRSRLYDVLGQGLVKSYKDGRRTLIDVASGDAYFTSMPPDRKSVV